MSGPPANIEPSELFRLLSEMPRPSQVVDFPRKIGPDGKPLPKMAIWVLTQEEQMACRRSAERLAQEHVKDGKKGSLGYEELYSDAMFVEVLFRACRVEGDLSRPVFPTPKHIRQTLSTDEIAVLFRNYMTVQLELGPIVATMTEEQMNAWIERLAEGGSAFPFDSWDSDVQRVLLLFMARLVVSLRTGTNSVGEQLVDSSSESTSDETGLTIDDDTEDL